MDHMALCKQALGTLRRRGVCQWIEAEELLSVGCVAILEAGATDEALAVTIARRAMIDAVRRHEVRERGRVVIREGCAGPDGDDITDGDQFDAAVHGGQNLRPENVHPELWEAMCALPPRDFRAVSLFFWGGKTQAEIAIEMGVSQRTVSTILEGAKNILKSLLNNSADAMTTTRGNGTRRTVLSGGTEAAQARI